MSTESKSNVFVSKATFKFLLDHDKTGKTTYTKLMKENFIENFINESMGKIFISRSESNTKVKGELKDSIKLDSSTFNNEIIETLNDNITNAAVYIGYTDGNFKNCDYLLIGEYDNQVISGRLYTSIDTDKSYGPLFASLADKIVEFGKSNRSVDSNLYKMMKRHKYTLVDESNKYLLFGKGHLADEEHKVTIKRDLDKLFNFMDISKKAVNEGQTGPIEFPVEELRYFKFIKK